MPAHVLFSFTCFVLSRFYGGLVVADPQLVPLRSLGTATSHVVQPSLGRKMSPHSIEVPITPSSPSILGQTTPASAINGDSQRRVRLRQACDACTTAKVKCDKGRPACQRCLDIDDFCQYSPSRRHGRRPRRARTSPRETPSSQPPQPLREVGMVEYSTMPSFADLFPVSTNIPMDMAAIPDFTFDNELDLSSLHVGSNIRNSHCAHSQDSTSSLNNAHIPPVQQQPSEKGGADMGLELVSRQDHKQEDGHASECEARALGVLKSLQYSPVLHDASPTAGYWVDSMERLLSTNKTALDELPRLLECRCVDSRHVALLHLTILSKIVSWYEVAVTAEYHSKRIVLKPMKIQFSVLDLDSDDYDMLHRAVLCRELQRAGGAIRKLEVRLATSDTPECAQNSAWGRLIIQAIRDELERCVLEMEKRPARNCS
ncbi:hypothetical protein PG997_007241 [Apiospora hydei]|uniref:Zn(2)-C6 fungal-type domain-containing protein n=1 Tax=Apiospora hydei TaxID=1337664 RepID=A0ABR1W7G2_9PEZI